MLKRYLRFLTCLVVALLGAYVPPAYAASAPLVLTAIQAGGTGAALQEMVVVYNNSPNQEVDISGWCLQNKSQVVFGCFVPQPGYAMILPSHGFAPIASTDFAALVAPLIPAVIYTPTHSGNGSIIGGGDSISLVDASGAIVDNHTWNSPLPGGTLFERLTIAMTPTDYLDNDSPADWVQVSSAGFVFPESDVINRQVAADICPNIDELQLEVPAGYVLDGAGECQPEPEVELPDLRITELLPNAAGSDAGKEFIELYNAGFQAVELSGLVLQIGQNFEKAYPLPAATIEPGMYWAMDNVGTKFSLLNSSSRVRLVMSDGTVLDETAAYQNPKDDQAWALISGTWQYTNRPTPGAPNLGMQVGGKPKSSTGTSQLKPCAVHQYRNPATNRCRNIASGVDSSLKPCAAHQERNPATNRCRNVIASGSTLTPCKEGQERNPDTNRCRTVPSMPEADYGVKGVVSSDDNRWYMWAAVGGVVLLAAAYAVWEWRHEIRSTLGKLLHRLRLRK